MLKLTDAATLKPCYVFGEVTGVQPMLASTAGIVPSRMVASTRVWYGCACVDVRETVDEVLALLAAERSRAMESSHGRSGTTHVCAGDDPASPTDEPGVDRPGCYTTDPVSASGCSKPISLGCDGCVANQYHNVTEALRVPAYMTMGEANEHAARASMEMAGFTVAADPSIQPDQVVLRSHTVDGKLLDEVRVVNVGTDPSGTDPFDGAADDEPAALSPRASVVITSLGTKAREVVRFLADRDPQTSLRILGAVFGGDDLDGPAGAASRVPMDQLKNLEIVQRVDRLPHDAGKPLMDRWMLTTLGREVARVLARV